MKMNKIVIIIVILCTVVLLLNVLLVYQTKPSAIAIQLESIQPSVTAPPPVPQQSPMPQISETNQVNPDASYTLYLKAERKSNITEYDLSYSKKDEEKKYPLYSTSYEGTTKLSIPFNTWSPDNKYVFVIEKNDSQIDYLVHYLLNEQVSEPVRITSLFAEKYPDYAIKNVTGWAAPGLLILISDKANGETGPSFWFNVATRTFTQLSTKF